MTVDKSLIEKYNQAAPRYTSYPPANHFRDDFTGEDYLQMLEVSNSKQPENIAFYVHIPFCEQICFYCGCNAIKLNKYSKVGPYISALKKEIAIVKAQLDPSRKISQIHFGGGTPNAVDVRYLQEIIEELSEGFTFIDKAEIAIECHPGLLSFDKLDALLDAGFNRFSLGIQDFDDKVLKAVNRRPAAIPVEDIVSYLRSKLTTVGINLDFIYGLPLQNKDSYTQSIKKAIAIEPDRLVTFSYAHVPWLKKHQEILQKQGLPSSEQKMAMFEAAAQLMKDAGYKAIGFDHFAKANDELSVAVDNKQLHRNFQGYCTRRTTGQVYAFGVSGISQLDSGYAQNTKSIDDYITSLNADKFPIEKGLSATREQSLVREVINQLMCNQYLHWEHLAKAIGTEADELKAICGYKAEKLEDMAQDGLLHFDEEHIEVTETGSVLIRNIAALFDPMFEKGEGKYSKTV